MKYTYGDGVEKTKSIALPFAFFATLFIAAYGYLNVQSPALLALIEPADITASRLAAIQPESSQDILYIPKINLETNISGASGADDSDALKAGAVHRSPLSGDPKQGGNFVVAAHQLSLAINPLETGVRSAFYHLDKVKAGDDLFVDFSGTRYAYRVGSSIKSSVSQSQLEQKSSDSQITLYSVEAKDGKRTVVIAKLVGHVVWVDGKPKLKPLDMTSSL